MSDPEETVSEHESPEPVPVTVSNVEWESLQNEATEYREKYMRLLAEQENLRKRLMKERDGLLKHAARNVLIDFLTPIDQMENALKFANEMSEEVKHWAIGFEMILNHFKDVLSQNGVAPMETEGKVYDPHLHHVTETVVTNEYPPGTIIKETLKGYTCGETTLRPAHVTIAKAEENKESLPVNEREENN